MPIVTKIRERLEDNGLEIVEKKVACPKCYKIRDEKKKSKKKKKK